MKRNFAGIPDEFAGYEKAKVILIPVPYDGTSTWVKGSDKGPEAFLDAAENMELYDIETGTEAYQQGIFLCDPITENSSPEAMTTAVHCKVNEEVATGKLVTLFGGEHSISIGAIEAMTNHYEDLTVLQIDAHADLRPSYQGSACSHACAVHWASRNTNLIQVGIRSMDISEAEFMNPEQTYFAQRCHEQEDRKWMQKILDQCTDNVYITIDLDAFDPSILPSTGTPEPGGLGFYQVLDLVKQVFQQCKVVGFDIVELCPDPKEKSSDFLAAKLYYKMLSYYFTPQE
jgi:agmatinase